MPALIVLLLAADAPPADVEPFFDSGGVHLVFVQSLHGLILGPSIYLAAANNTREDTGGLVAPAVLVPVTFSALGIVAAHWLRPSVVTAYESAVLGWAGALAGFSVADAYVEARRPAFNLNWLWSTRLVAGAVGYLIGSTVALVPRQENAPGWRTWAVLGGTVVGAAALIGLLSSRPSAEFDPTIAWAYVLPFALGCATSVLWRALSIEAPLQIAPTPILHGSGVSVGGRW